MPDLLTLGDETFIADAVMLGDEEVDGGWMTLKPTVISRRSFVGNEYLPRGHGTLVAEIAAAGGARRPAARR